MGPTPAARRPRAEAAGIPVPRGQAEPEMPVAASRPRPSPGPPPAWPFSLLLLGLLTGPVYGRVPRSVPRTSLPISEADSYLTRFTVPQTYNYSVLLVDPASHTLYVGARDTIFALSLPFTGERPRRIDWMVPEAHRENCRKKGKKEGECHNFVQILIIANASHLLTCGTFAFDPKCGVIDVSSFQQVERLESGRGKCPFDPAQRSAAIMAGGVLYAATVKNYLGTEPIISRAVGRAEDWIRTETLRSWLSAPAFVAAVALSPAEWGDEDGDDEIYFFFTETSRVFDTYESIKVPRVARVCAGDLGGRKTLQQRWTTFLKADLLCPGPEHGRASSVLQDMAILRPESGVGAPIFYGIFSSQWEGATISAVCTFRPQDIRTALKGPFRELKHDCNRGLPVLDNDVPQPRPGECITNNMKLQQFGSSLSLPDRVLTFIRDHPLMDRPVFPPEGRPLLVTTDTAYLRVVAHRVTSLSGKEYDVLYLGTEDGHLHRAVRIGAQLSVLEDLALFPEPQPVEVMKLYQGWLLIGSRTEVTQVNTTNCGRLQSCSECILAQDPACAWSFHLHACVAHAGEHGGLVQDIESADVSSLCPKEPGESPVVFEVPVAKAAHVVLPCSPSSAWASCVWHQPDGVTALTPRRDGLEVVVTPGAMGAYACECQEGGAARVVAAYSLVWGSQRDPPSRAHTMGVLLAGFFLGVLAASLTLLLVGRHQQRRRHRELLARDKVGLDLGAPPSGTTSYSQDPPSPSPEDERLPLALAKRGSGFGGFPPPFLLDPCPSPAHIRLTGAPLATCDETSI
ncbi:PREDICTED: semaphorin-4F isoform X1 [Condylura cristata]|uniref:semaphorin-4F isoform X1 n=1 Tax=Condylura cristata TaxID=143302 RepID=UPI0003346C2C|nr:PREDICTED: semaphorin-4F isoform X1 [Condylura cristata]